MANWDIQPHSRISEALASEFLNNFSRDVSIERKDVLITIAI